MMQLPAVTTPNQTGDLPDIWELPLGVFIFTSVFLIANIVLSLVTNLLLIAVIYLSPNLKTPPNTHLVNICCNNIVLAVSMILSLGNVSVPLEPDFESLVLSGIQIGLTYNCFFQYLGAFASIGYYRSRLIRHSSMPLKHRKSVITRSIMCSWVISVLVSLMGAITFAEKDEYACITINPFKQKCLLCDELRNDSLNKVSIVVIMITVFLSGLVVIVTSYYGIFRTLNISGTFGKNRIIPAVTMNVSTEIEDSSNMMPGSYTPSQQQETDKSSYAVRPTPENLEMVVHYEKNDHVLTFEDIIALENPILASNLRKQCNQKRALQLSRSTASNASVQSKSPEFTDISPGADLQRYQNFKNTVVLKNHLLKRDRVSLSGTTKNSIIMLVSFLVFSLPMFVCNVPTVMANVKQSHRVLIILFCKITFYLNAPIYPLWYLIYNVHVRRCLMRFQEGLLVKLRLRK